MTSLAQDQRQRVLTWNIAPGYQHTFNANTLLTVNIFARRDQVDYYGSRDPVPDDTPVAATQNRFLTNYGVKADISHVQGKQEIKAGVQIQQTRLMEKFTLGVTDPLYNAPCVDSSGACAVESARRHQSRLRALRSNPTFTANLAQQPGSSSL